MEIQLYKYAGSANVISKTLGTYKAINGYMSNDLEIDNPIIKLTTYTLDYNYIYIPILKRYYFIDDVTIDPNGVYILRLSIDVLMSFKDDILKCLVHVIETDTSNNFDVSQSQNETPLTYFNTVNLTNPFDFENKSTILIGLNTGTEV